MRQFRAAYLAALEEGFGQNPNIMEERLEEIWQVTKQHNERRMESCERCAMAEEERRHRRAAVEEWEQRRKERSKEALSERFNRQAMRREDTRSRREERLQGRRSRWDERLVQRIRHLVERWQRGEERRGAQEVRQRAVAERAAARTAAAAAREERRRLKVAMDARWKHMNRRDITMAELIESRWGGRRCERRRS